MLRVERPRRPRQRREHEHHRPREADLGMSSQRVRPDEQPQAGQTQCEAREHERGRTAALRPRPVEQHHPQWHHGHQQRRDARRHALLGPHHAAVAAQQQQTAADQPGSPVHARRTARGVAKARPEHEDDAGDDETGAGHQQGRQRLHREANREVRGAPDDVDSRECGDQASAHRANIAGGTRGWLMRLIVHAARRLTGSLHKRALPVRFVLCIVHT